MDTLHFQAELPAPIGVQKRGGDRPPIDPEQKTDRTVRVAFDGALVPARITSDA